MSRMIVAMLALGAGCTIGSAQPSIDAGGIANGASLTPEGLPGAAIAQGSILIVSGHGLGPATPVVGTFPLTTTLAGASLNVTVGGTVISPFIFSARADEITALLPSQTPEGLARFR
jgi:uncharacterized protein (TIGR03437 family)